MANNQLNGDDERTRLQIKKAREGLFGNTDALQEVEHEKDTRLDRALKIAEIRETASKPTITAGVKRTLVSEHDELVEVHNEPVERAIERLEDDADGHDQVADDMEDHRGDWSESIEWNRGLAQEKREQADALRDELEPTFDDWASGASTMRATVGSSSGSGSPRVWRVDVRAALKRLKSNRRGNNRPVESIEAEIENHRDRAEALEEQGKNTMAADARAGAEVLEAYKDGQETIELVGGKPGWARYDEEARMVLSR